MKPTSLKELVRYTWDSSNFYRTFWERQGFNAKRDFKKTSDLDKIPILTKEDLLATSTRERTTLLAQDRYYFAAISSGTAARPLISFQSQFSAPSYYRFIEGNIKRPYSSVFILRPASYAAAMIGATVPEKYFRPGSIISLGETSDLTSSATLAREVEADMLVARPSEAIRFAAVLEKQGYSPSRIMLLYGTGEPLTSAATSLLKRSYPDALILYNYAMTEGPASLGMRSSLCATLDALSPSAYHLNMHDFIIEEVGGSSIVTALHIIPTPLIRYDTRDHIAIKRDLSCSCGFPVGAVGAIGPRVGEQSYKIGGYTFRAEEIRHALQKLPELVTDDFVLHVEQTAIGMRLVNSLRFVIRPVGVPTPVLAGIIAKVLEREIRVTRSWSLGDAIRNGMVQPLGIDYDTALAGAHILPPAKFMAPFQDD